MKYVIEVEVDEIESSQLSLVTNESVRKSCEFVIRGVLLQAMSARLQTCWHDGYSKNGGLDSGSFDPAPATPERDEVQQFVSKNLRNDKDLIRTQETA